MIHDARIVPLDTDPQGRPGQGRGTAGSGSPRTQSNGDGRAAPDGKVRQWMGISRGRWEGETLVIETTNFNGKNPFQGSTENMKVIERLTRVADDTIEYRFTVEDPSMWTRPWSAESALTRTTGPLFEHACHEGNYGLYNTLVGARLEERAARAERGAQ
jgi:hypothetical protein